MILRRIARPLLATIFVSGGINSIRYSEGHAQAAGPLLEKITGKEGERKLPDSVPTDPETLVKIDGATKVVAGAAFSLGIFPRLSAALLLSSLLPTTLAAHAYWDIEDEAERGNQRIQFLKNLGLAGGLLLAVADTGGKPSLAWRARHGTRSAEHCLRRS